MFFSIGVYLFKMKLSILTGELINLRQPRHVDEASIRRHVNDPEVARFVPPLPYPYSKTDARLWVNTCFRLARRDEGYNFGIESKETGEIIGMIGLKNINRESRNAEVGYWLGQKFWRRGFTSEALGLILNFSFQELKLVRVYVIVYPLNVGSVCLLENAGFLREATWRKANYMNRRWYDVYSYGLLKEEFQDRK